MVAHAQVDIRQTSLTDFRHAICAAGLEPPDIIESGKLHRFPGAGKRPGNRAGWCLLFADGMGGCFGDWASGLSETWQTKRDRPFSQAEKAAFARRVAQAKRQVEEERASQREAGLGRRIFRVRLDRR